MERRTQEKKIYIIIYEKSQFDSLLWGSLTLAPIMTLEKYTPSSLSSHLSLSSMGAFFSRDEQVTSIIWQLLQHSMRSGRQGQQKSMEFLYPSEKAPKKLRVVLQCIFERDFLSLHTKVSGILNHHSASLSCYSDNLAWLLPDIWG